jgi:hypothetical protein
MPSLKASAINGFGLDERRRAPDGRHRIAGAHETQRSSAGWQCKMWVMLLDVM